MGLRSLYHYRAIATSIVGCNLASGFGLGRRKTFMQAGVIGEEV